MKMFWEMSVTEIMAFDVNIYGWICVAAMLIAVVVAIVRFEKKKKKEEEQ